MTLTIVRFRDKWVKISVLAACSICVLKSIIYMEVLKYLFGINGLRDIKETRMERVDANVTICYRHCIREMKALLL